MAAVVDSSNSLTVIYFLSDFYDSSYPCHCKEIERSCFWHTMNKCKQTIFSKKKWTGQGKYKTIIYDTSF